MEDEQIKLKVDSKVDAKLEQREAEQDPIEWKPPEPNPTEPNSTEPNSTEPNPTEPNPTESNPTDPNPTEPKPELKSEFTEELKPNCLKNVKWFLGNTPISAIFVFYLLITVGAILCDKHSQYRNYIRPWVVNYNAAFLIALFWSMVERTKRYPICICYLVNIFLLICDIYCLGSIASSNSYDYGFNYRYNYDRNYNDTNSSYWLLFVSFVSRPLVCYVLFGKFMNQIDEAKKIDECLNKSEYHACNTKSNEWSVYKLKKYLHMKIPVHYIFGFCFFISILIICIDSPRNFDENKWLVVVSDVLLLISFAFFLAIDQVKSKSLMLMSVIGFNLLAAWTDFNLICYLHFDVRDNFTVHIYVSFWLLVFSLFTRPYTTIILHRHSLSFPKLEIESEIAKLWTNLKINEDVEANEKTSHAKPWDQCQKETENEDTIATKKAKCFKCSFSIEF